MIITLKFGPGICTNKKNCFLILKKKYTFFVVHCPQNIPLAWNAQSTHRQMNKPLSPIPARTCWDTIFRAQGASDQLQALKLTRVIKQKGQSEVPPWDIIYVQNLPGKQGSSNNFFPPPDTQRPMLGGGGSKTGIARRQLQQMVPGLYFLFRHSVGFCKLPSV